MHIAKLALIYIFSIFLLLAASQIQSFGQTTETPQKSSETAPVDISMAEVAGKSSEVIKFLTALFERFDFNRDVEKIRSSFNTLDMDIDTELSDTLKALQRQPTLADIQSRQAFWKLKQLKIAAELKSLTKQSVDLQEILDQLSVLLKTWNRTHQAADVSQAPESTRQQIQTVRDAIWVKQETLRAYHTEVLILQSRVSEALAKCDISLSRIAQAQQGTVAGIMKRERPPIWRVEQLAIPETFLSTRISEIYLSFRSEIRQYFQDSSREMPLQFILFVVLTLDFVHFDYRMIVDRSMPFTGYRN